MLLGLAIHPIADRLLLNAHLRNQALDRFSQIGHGGRGGLVTAGLGNSGTQPLNRVSHVARTTVGEDGFGGVVVDRSGEPVFEFGVEPVLGSTRLQIEKAEHQRTGKAE